MTAAESVQRCRADQLHAGEHGQDRVRLQVHRGALRDHAAEDAAERRTHADPSDVALRARDVEALVDDRPEARDQDRTRDVEVKERDHRDRARVMRDQQPLDERDQAAHRVHRGDEAMRPEPDHQLARENDQR